MNENLERLRALEAENKDLQKKLDNIATTTTPPPGFGCQSSCTLHASSGYHCLWRDKPISSPKYGSYCPNSAYDSGREHDRYGGHDFYFN
ncbi:hypothetical protein ACOSP7_007038 [Xanthoceras sorbifolium]